MARSWGVGRCFRPLIVRGKQRGHSGANAKYGQVAGRAAQQHIAGLEPAAAALGLDAGNDYMNSYPAQFGKIVARSGMLVTKTEQVPGGWLRLKTMAVSCSCLVQSSLSLTGRDLALLVARWLRTRWCPRCACLPTGKSVVHGPLDWGYARYDRPRVGSYQISRAR